MTELEESTDATALAKGDKTVSANAAMSATPAQKPEFRHVNVGPFEIDVPFGWRAFAAPETAELRSQYIAQSQEIYRQYSGAPDPASSVDIAAFHVGNDEGAFIIVSFSVPPQENIVDSLRHQVDDKVKWGIQQGYIQEFLELVPFDDEQLAGFYAKFIGPKGDVQITGGLEHKQLIGTLVQMTLLSPAIWDEPRATSTLTSILDSVRPTQTAAGGHATVSKRTGS